MVPSDERVIDARLSSIISDGSYTSEVTDTRLVEPPMDDMSCGVVVRLY
jgi:hypothetical protein